MPEAESLVVRDGALGALDALDLVFGGPPRLISEKILSSLHQEVGVEGLELLEAGAYSLCRWRLRVGDLGQL